MKKILSSVLVLTILSATIAIPGLVSAAPADAPPGSKIEERVKLRIAEQNLNLSQKDITRYTGKCIGSQAKVREIQSKLGSVSDKRLNTYEAIDAKLWVIIGKLKLADKDTFKLESQRAEYAKKVAVLSNTMNQYKQVIDDTVVINCQSDIKGYMSLVATARLYHEAIRKQTEEIKGYVVNDVKASLQAFASELQPKPSTEQ